MLLLDRENLADYLRATRRIDPKRKVQIQLLAGGVSNIVLRVEPEGDAAFVIKQARERLRTEAPWFSRLDRIWRETTMMRAVGPLLPAGAVPRILFDDRDNYLFAMEAVDPRHVVWKLELLAGRIEPEIAVCLAKYLATIHRSTRRDNTIAREFDDREIFVQLRVDPFYRHIARAHADLRVAVEALIDEMWRTRGCLVHADFSPKNVLVIRSLGPDAGDSRTRPQAPRHGDAEQNEPAGELQVTLVDFETGHYGDPAFDVGFFLSHLLLKAVRVLPLSSDEGQGEGRSPEDFIALADTFWSRYREEIASASDDPGFEP